MRKSSITILAILAVTLLCCPITKAGENKNYGLSFPSLAISFFTSFDEGAKERAKELGVNVFSIEANSDVSRQISIVEDMVVSNFAGVLLVPIVTEAVIPAIEKLNAAGIPVVTGDRAVSIPPDSPAKILAHIGADNVLGGEKAAKFIIDGLIKRTGAAKGTVIELYGFVGSSPAIDRSEGFNRILSQYPDIPVKTQAASFLRVEGMKVMEDFIMSTPQIDAVFGANDDMIMGAIEAMEASGKFDLSKVIPVGFDAMEDAKQSVRDGVLTATIDQFPSKQGAEGFQILYDFVVNGKSPASSLVLLEPEVLTKENIGAF